MAKNKGKTIWFITPTIANEINAAAAKGVTVAATAAGMSAHVWDGKNSVPVLNQGVKEAAAQGAGGIILGSVSPGQIEDGLNAAKAAGIPVVNWNDDDPGAPLNGVDARVPVAFTKDGEVLAAYALTKSNCKGTHALVLYAGQFNSLVGMSHGFAKYMTDKCPTCKVTEFGIDVSTLSTKLGPLVVSDAQKDPELRWVVVTFDFMATVIVPALEAAGLKDVRVLGHDGNPSNLDYIKKNEVQVADMAYPPAEYQGWLMVDQVGRLMAGQPPADVVVPTQLVSTDDVSAVDKLNASFGDYQAAFKKLWGVP